MFTPPFRTVLLKSIGLAILLLIMLGIGLHRLFAWLAARRRRLSGGRHRARHADAAACAALGAGDRGRLRACGRRDLHHAGGDGVRRELLLRRDRRRGRARALSGRSARHAGAGLDRAAIEGVKTALLALLVYLMRGAVPAVRRARLPDLLRRERVPARAANISCSPRCAFIRSRRRRRCARRHHGTIVLAGAFIAAFVSIPILNLATPLFGMAFMMHMHKRIAGPRRELIEHT